jgi:hypothetical protein
LARVRDFFFALLGVFLSIVGCGRSDFLSFDSYGDAGEGGTTAGGSFSGGSFSGGSFSGGSFSGGSFTGGSSTGGSFTGGTGTGGFCSGGLWQCGEQCVDIFSNERHCGACFSACSFDSDCIMGACLSRCPNGTFCSGVCTDVRIDPDNCGTCDVSCNDESGGFCENGRCRCGGRQVSCPTGCVDLQTDLANCGRCGIACAEGQICADGACRFDCPSDFAECGGECRNLLTDPDHCGTCNNSCPRAQVCRNGACDTSCGNLTSCNGICRDLAHDPGHCGSCTTACAADEVCIEGTCSFLCGPGITNCNGTCKDLRVDPQNCGACGQQCGMRQSCTNGLCTTIPDAFSYAVTTSPLSFIHACTQPGAVTQLRNVDDQVATAMLPFSFRFYGVPAASAWFSSNGLLGFGSSTDEWENDCTFGEPGTRAPNSILAFWDDLITRPGGVCTATIGVAPNRQFVTTWNDAQLLGVQTTTNLTFSVVLSEGTDVIDVLYGIMSGGANLSAGGSASIGLSNATYYALDCCNQPCVTSNSGRRYTPVIR